MTLRARLRSADAQTVFTLAAVAGAVIAVYTQWPTLRRLWGRL